MKGLIGDGLRVLYYRILNVSIVKWVGPRLNGNTVATVVKIGFEWKLSKM
jgi:hypothetical protein